MAVVVVVAPAPATPPEQPDITERDRCMALGAVVLAAGFSLPILRALHCRAGDAGIGF